MSPTPARPVSRPPGLPPHRRAPWECDSAGATPLTQLVAPAPLPSAGHLSPPAPFVETAQHRGAPTPAHQAVPGPRAAGPSASQVFWDRLGAVLVVVGVVLGMWIAWVLVGSNLEAKISQSRSAARLEAMTPVPAVAADDPSFAVAAAAPAPAAAVSASGSETARIQIPSIGVDAVVFSGTDPATLRKGPGIWEHGVMPGAPGNATISGHRTTYGAPFRRLDELSAGDRIIVSTPGQPDAVFEVRGSTVVPPSGVGVTAQTPGVRLTLTTCTPVGSDAERLVVQAELVSGTHAAAALPAAAWSLQR